MADLPNDSTRCPWAKTDLSIAYHDREWGVPVRDERTLFEFLILEGAQAGLSWETILRKRDRYREVFEGFDPERVSRFTPRNIEALLQDPGIVRNRLKVESAVSNARVFLTLRDQGGGAGAAAAHLWSFVGGQPVVNRPRSFREVPASTAQSDAMSADLRRRGFRFVGTTICYAFMQAVGMVNDHLVTCPRHARIAELAGGESRSRG